MAEQTNAIDLIIQDHRAVESMFQRYESARNSGEKTRIVHEVVHDLAVHGEIEELLFYPRLRDVVDGGDALAEEAVHEHVEIKETLNDLDKMTADDDGFDLRMQELMAEVRHHVEEEEHDILPRFRQAVAADELTKLGERMQAAKSIVPTRPHPKAPTGPAGKAAASPPVALIDRVRDALRSARYGD